jgi:NADH dehydrogenase FAD-containing subunit
VLEEVMDGRPRILIVGGGHGGMHTVLYRGVAEVFGLRMRGFPAWIVHRTYHLLKLPTVNRRLRVVADWTLALLFPARGRLPRHARAPAPGFPGGGARHRHRAAP